MWRSIVPHLAVLAVTGWVVAACGDAATSDEVPPAALASMPEPPIGSLELASVPEASVPMVIEEHLASIQAAVAGDVGRDVFAGGRYEDAATAEVTLTVFGTDKGAIARALDRHASGDLLDRITVVEVQYSVNDLERFAAEAELRLADAEIDGTTWIQWGLDAIALTLYTADGERDAALEAQALDAMGDIPVVVSFSRPLIPAG